MKLNLQIIGVVGVLLSIGQGVAEEEKQDPRAKIAVDNPRVNMRGGFQRFLKRAESGELTRVVTLGGSITEAKQGHSSQIPKWLKKQFPKADFQFTNAGISSTCSTTGA